MILSLYASEQETSARYSPIMTIPADRVPQELQHVTSRALQHDIFIIFEWKGEQRECNVSLTKTIFNHISR